MTGNEWQLIAGLVDEWWPGKFERSQQDAWFVALEGFEAQALTDALKAQLARGGVHRPSLGELIAELRADPGRPTFDEAFALIYGPRGVLRARPAPGGEYDNEAAMLKARDQAGLERASAMHPLLFEFVSRYSVGRLRSLEVDHEVYGEVTRRELRERWERHCAAMKDREIAAIGSGRRGVLGQFDPLSALARPVGQLEPEREE